MGMDSMSYCLFTDDFKKKKVKYQDVSPALFELYKKKISVEFADMMLEEGLCTYAEGLFTLVDPRVYDEVLKQYNVYSDKCITLVKNAFGDLFYYDGFECRVLYTSYNEQCSFAGGGAVKYFFTFQLTDATFLRKNFKKKLFGEAVKQYGKLEPDETYGFIPALPLGGEETCRSIRKVKTIEYLNSLSQAFLWILFLYC